MHVVQKDLPEEACRRWLESICMANAPVCHREFERKGNKKWIK